MIKDIIELKPSFPDYATLSQAEVNLQDMGEKTITTQVRINGSVIPDFSTVWAVEFKGEKYIMPLLMPQAAKENTSLNSTIDLTFQHWAIYQLKRWYFFTVPPVTTGTAVPDKYIASVSLNLKGFCKLCKMVLNYYYGDKIIIDFNDPDIYADGWKYKIEPTVVEISHSYIWDVLIKLYDLYAVHWEIVPNGDSGHYKIKVGYPTTEITHEFKYGFEGGLLKIERQVQDDNIRNMIIGRGGNTNLPKYYFKKSPDEKKFRSDPDWIPELANMPFTELRGATFRSYVQGWNHKHYQRTKITSSALAYAPWAWMRGYMDEMFNPVEYVADEFTVSDNGYRVAAGSSIDKYGELMGGLENNDKIYPTIQGVSDSVLGRLDEVVAVEPILSDDVSESTENDAQLRSFGRIAMVACCLSAGYSMTVRHSYNLTVEDGKYANFYLHPHIIAVKKANTDIFMNKQMAELVSSSVSIRRIDGTGEALQGSEEDEKLAVSGIPAGNYYIDTVFKVKNVSKTTLDITVGDESPEIMEASPRPKWVGSWSIWIKKVFSTPRRIDEDDEAYAERVWRPILGDGVGNTAKVMFSDGMLGISEDYEFTIIDIPQLDTKQKLPVYDNNGNQIAEYTSYWRIHLAKSDAELEATGLYLPSTQRQASAGDHFLFIGTEMTHEYTLWAEQSLDDNKKDNLNKVKDIKPTYVVSTDRVRLNGYGSADALINQLKVGSSITLYDRRFIPGSHQEKKYIQSVTYKYREPTDTDAALNPDVDMVLSDNYATTANPVATLQGEVSALSRQIGSISNIEQIVRAVGDVLYLRKDGFPDVSQSPTRFSSLLTSGGFRSGLIGGVGWGFYKDDDGKWVCEADRFKARTDFEVNNLVINQVSWRGGMIVESAAQIEVTGVAVDNDGYVCYFDQKNGSVANLFQVGDVAYCNRYTPDNNELKYYKRRVVAVSENSITLAAGNAGDTPPAGWPDSGVSGSGVPEVGDNVIHFGSYTTPSRRYVKVRDVIGGGYERYLENLDSVNADGLEYYFVGRQAGLYDDLPRWFIGDTHNYIKYENHILSVKAKLSVESTVEDTPLDKYIEGKIPLSEVGGANLLLNADFGEGFEHWVYTQGGLPYPYVQLSESVGIDGRTSVYIRSTGATGYVWRQIQQGISQPSEYMSVRPGENIVVSVYTRTPEPDGIDADAMLEIRYYRADGTEYPSYALSVKPTVAEEWQRFISKVTVPSEIVRLGIAIYVRQNGELYVSSPKVERGTVATDWTLSPVDEQSRLKSLDYLKAALKQSTTAAGGLVQMSLLRLGHIPEGGTEFVEMAGTNGLYDPFKGGKTIASWWGGAMLDKADFYDWDDNTHKWVVKEGAEPDESRIASALIRMDGSGYFSKGALWWNVDGILHSDPMSFIVGENYLGISLALFRLYPNDAGHIGDVQYVEPQAPFRHLRIGIRSSVDGVVVNQNGLIEWDEENQSFKFNGSLYATGNLVSYGPGVNGGGTGDGGGGTAFGLMREWPATAPGADTADALGANLGYELNTRLLSIESAGYATTEEVTRMMNNATSGFDSRYVQALSVRGGNLVWTKNDVDHTIENLNAATATRLASTLKLWGQSFDGTADVSGRWELDGKTNSQLSIFWDSASLNAKIQSWAGRPLILNPAGNNVGIGNISTPAAKLHVEGSFRSASADIVSATTAQLYMSSSSLRCQITTGTGDNQLLAIDGASLANGVASWRCAILRAGINGHITFGAAYPLDDYLVYITENMRVAKGITVNAGQCIYLNESHTAWLRYNAAADCIETNVDLVSQKDIISFKE